MIKEVGNIRMNGMPHFDEKIWVSPQNFDSEVMTKSTSKQVYIHDVTLRDGEQTPGLNWTEKERVEIGLLLNQLGVKSIEVGMPIISEDIVRATRTLMDKDLQSTLVGFCRARKDDIDYCERAGLKTVIVEHAVNPYTNMYGYNSDDQKVIERISTALEYAQNKGMETTFMGWDVTRAPLDYLLDMYGRVIERFKLRSIVFTDSFGVATPEAIKKAIKAFKNNFQVPLEFHLHNEFGMAMGSVTSAVYAGVDGIHSSINGLGERTGNVSTEEVIAALEILLNVRTGTNMALINKVTKRLSEITLIPIPTNKPVTGTKLFWLESGVVVQVKERLEKAGIQAAMSPYLPEIVGREPIHVVLGGSSGKESIKYYLEKHAIEVKEDFSYEDLLDAVKHFAREKRGNLTDQEFLEVYKRFSEDTESN